MPRSPNKSTKPTGNRRGVKASKYVFTEEQDKIIRGYCEDLKNNIHNLLKNPEAPNRDRKLTEWKQSSADKILALPEFAHLDMEIHNGDRWKVVCV